jgi:hypothetical protein
MNKTILVQAAATQTDMEDDGPALSMECESISEAKKRAKYYLSEKFARAAEMKEPFGYSRIVVNGEIEYDFEA